LLALRRREPTTREDRQHGGAGLVDVRDDVDERGEVLRELVALHRRAREPEQRACIATCEAAGDHAAPPPCGAAASGLPASGLPKSALATWPTKSSTMRF